MRITDAKVIVTCPGRNFVTLKLTTEDGIYGLGDATVNGRELAVASYLSDHVAPLLIGRDARRIEDTWQYLYKGAYWRRGPITMAAIGAVDTALWDVKAKSLNVPLYQLLGGASREAVLVYGHASGNDIEDTVAPSPTLPGEATRPYVRSRRSRESPAPTAWAAGSSTTSRPRREIRRKTSGVRSCISILCRASSNACAKSSGRSFTCSTTSTIA